jgi:hypothetical protein
MDGSALGAHLCSADSCSSSVAQSYSDACSTAQGMAGHDAIALMNFGLSGTMATEDTDSSYSVLTKL